jgi:hypothetical protein
MLRMEGYGSHGDPEERPPRLLREYIGGDLSTGCIWSSFFFILSTSPAGDWN